MGRLKCLTKGSKMGGSPCNPKSLNFPRLLNITPTKELSPPVSPLITDHILIQNCLAGSSPRIIPHYPPKPLWKTKQQKNLLIFLTRKILNKFIHLPLSNVSLLPFK